MGTWGTGLYANDAAADLKATLATLLRLPLQPDEIVETLKQQQLSLTDPGSEDYTACWFVVADRFHRYGIEHGSTITLVQGLIANRTDLEINRSLGMSDAGLRRRAKVLSELDERLSHPHPRPFRRTILKRPQEFLLETGDVIRFPMMAERSANPYFKSWAAQRPPFVPDRFGAAVIVDQGRAFAFLAWYTAMMLSATWTSPPTIADCLSAETLTARAGTLSATHMKRMAIERLASVVLGTAVRDLLPPAQRATSAAVSDISLSNALNLPRHAQPPAGGSRRRLRDLVIS